MWIACPADDLIVRFTCQVCPGLLDHFFERCVDALDGVVGVENQDAVRSGVEQCIQTLFLVGDLSV